MHRDADDDGRLISARWSSESKQGGRTDDGVAHLIPTPPGWKPCEQRNRLELLQYNTEWLVIQ
jgi:hypothetical protein